MLIAGIQTYEQIFIETFLDFINYLLFNRRILFKILLNTVFNFR